MFFRIQSAAAADDFFFFFLLLLAALPQTGIHLRFKTTRTVSKSREANFVLWDERGRRSVIRVFFSSPCRCSLYFYRSVVNFYVRVQVSFLSCSHLAARRVAIKRANCTRRSSSILCGLLSLLTPHKHYPAEVAFHCWTSSSTMKLKPAVIFLTLYSPCGGRVMGPIQNSETLPNGLPLCRHRTFKTFFFFLSFFH